MFGLDAPAPSGPPSPELMRLVQRAAASRWFRLKVRTWLWVRRSRGFNWESFQVNLEKAEFREFRDKWQAKRSVGWAGQNP